MIIEYFDKALEAIRTLTGFTSKVEEDVAPLDSKKDSMQELIEKVGKALEGTSIDDVLSVLPAFIVSAGNTFGKEHNLSSDDVYEMIEGIFKVLRNSKNV